MTENNETNSVPENGQTAGESTPPKKKRRKSLKFQIAANTLIPILLMGVLFLLIGMYSIRKIAVTEMFTNLEGNAKYISTHFSNLKGTFHMDGGELFCGDRSTREEYPFLKEMKETYGIEISIFYGNNRVMTTLTDSDGSPLLGTMLADSRIISGVFKENTVSTEKNNINRQRYLCVYVPLHSNSQVVGMVGCAISMKNFYRANQALFIQIAFLTAITAVVTFILITLLSNQMVRRLTYIRDYMEELVTSKTTEQEMNPSVFRRNDEIAELGEHSIAAGASIKSLIGTDPLTGLYNRRFGRQKIKNLREKAHDEFSVFTIVIGDLDHFKKVNDEYGHDMGDTVLSGVSAILKKHAEMHDGFAVRWGGEEFLLGFETAREETCDILKEISKEIKRTPFYPKNHAPIHLSMTFGVATYNGQDKIDDIINAADANLYKGKNQGRDCIVS